MKSKKKILIAFNSVTMRSLIHNFLESAGYNIIEAVDGVEAFNKMLDEKPDCIVSFIDLPEISGYSLSRIIKNTKELKHIGVVLAATEDTSVYHFWSRNSKSDEFYVIRPNNQGYLLSLVEKCLEKCSYIPVEEMNEIQKNDIHNIVTNAYDRELFNLYITQNAYMTSGTISDIEILVDKIAENISGVVDYDSAGFIVNCDQIIERYYRKSIVSDTDFEEFKEICHNDFKKRLTNRRDYKWENSNYKEEITEELSAEEEKLKSYEIFPTDSTKKYALTIHIACTNDETLNRRTVDRLNFFTDIYSMIVENAVFISRVISSEHKMRNSFGRFLPDKIIKNIINGNLSISDSVGERRRVAVLIMDIRDFTSLSEVNNPETVVTFLNQYFGTMGEIIRKHGGTIDKFMGDAIMALFGAPDSYIDNANRAANAALEMIDTPIDTKILHLPEGYEFKFGIGIHYGEMIAGTVGSNERKEYTVIGDNVNIASRVEGLSKIFGTPIIVTEAVKEDVEQFYSIESEGKDKINIPSQKRYLGTVKVKGKKLPVKIYELTADTNKYTEEFLEYYSKGLDRYQDKDLKGALLYFTKASSILPEDEACLYCIDECNRLLQDFLPEDWDGCFRFIVK